MVLQQQFAALLGAAIAGKCRWVLESELASGGVCDEHTAIAFLHHMIAGDIGMAAAFERHGAIEELGGALHHRGGAGRVQALARREVAIARDHVGAVEGVVEAAPAGVGGVEGVASVRDRHDELRAADRRNLGVESISLDGEVRRLGHEIADLAQEGFVAAGIGADRAVGFVPLVDLVLHLVAEREELAVLRGEVAHQPRETVPELRGRNAGAGDGFLLDEIHQQLIDLQAGLFDVSHVQIPQAASFDFCGSPIT